MSVKNLNKVLKSLKKFGKEADNLIDIYAEDTANQISVDAKLNAPKNLGKLAQSISSAEKVSDLNYKVVVKEDYAPYIEFGTGKKVRVPSEMQELANKVKKRGGTFEQGLESIKDWCKAKGIDVKLAYPIFISILNNGINPQPFLYPAFVKGRKNFIKDLKNVLDDLTKKYN